MPVIDTRKRKPTSGSALDQLAAISAQELASGALNSTAGRGFDHAGTSHYEDDSSSSLVDRELLRRVPMHKRQRLDGDASAMDYDQLASEISHMKQNLRRAEQALAARHGAFNQPAPMNWSSTHTLSEILKLQMTLETALGLYAGAAHYHPLELARANPHENFDCGPLMVEAIRRDVVRLHSFLTEQRVDSMQVGQHVGPVLEALWLQASRHAADNVKGKLVFWKHHAEDLKERLRVALDATKKRVTVDAAVGESATPSPAAAPVSPAVEAALQSALDFVSTFYIMDTSVAFSDPADPAKDKAVSSATASIIEALRRLDASQADSRSVINLQPTVNFTPQQQAPTQRPNEIQTSDRVPYEPEPSPPSTVNSTTTNFFGADDDGDDPSEEDEPLPMHSPTFATAAQAAAPRAMAVHGTHMRSTPAPAAADGGSNVVGQKKSGVPLAARRRLAAVLESQLSQSNNSTPTSQDKAAPRPSIPGKPVPPTAKPTTAQTTSRDVAETPHIASIRTTATTSSPSTANGCAKCNRNDSQHSLLLCDNDCGREFHTFCLVPPLATIPDGDWFCPPCREAEYLLPDQRVYLCSASLCDKITATKYCSLHRCQIDKCLNRNHSNGLCRRHEGHRTNKAPVPTAATPAKAKATTVPTSSSSPAPPKEKTATSKSKLSDEQIIANMREMGIWLPAKLPGKKTTKADAKVAAKPKKPQQPRRS